MSSTSRSSSGSWSVTSSGASSFGHPNLRQLDADAFNASGYRTAYFGKWHLGGFHERSGRAAFFITDPARRGGFETWTGYENNNSQWDCWVHAGAGVNAFHYRLPGYETDELTAAALVWG